MGDTLTRIAPRIKLPEPSPAKSSYTIKQGDGLISALNSLKTQIATDNGATVPTQLQYLFDKETSALYLRSPFHKDNPNHPIKPGDNLSIDNTGNVKLKQESGTQQILTKPIAVIELPEPAPIDSFSPAPAKAQSPAAKWVKENAQVIMPPKGTKIKGTIILDPGHGRYLGDPNTTKIDIDDPGAVNYYKTNKQGKITDVKHVSEWEKLADKDSYKGPVNEADLNLDIENKTGELLAKNCYKVIITMKDHDFAGYKEAGTRLNGDKPDREGILRDLIEEFEPKLVLDVQNNSVKDHKAQGYRTYADKTNKVSSSLTLEIQNQFIEEDLTGKRDAWVRGAEDSQHGSLRVLRITKDNPQTLGILTELGFSSNSNDLKALLQKEEIAGKANDQWDIAKALSNGIITGLK